MRASLFIVLLTLYISQGLPSGILAHVLPALMRQEGVELYYIGMLKLLALPWALKFLWAPYVDRYGLSSLGTHRTWILFMQSTLVVLFIWAAFTEQSLLFGALLIPFLFSVVLINTAAATQDIATDGLAVKLLPEKLRGLGNSIQVAGYKIGMILSSSLLLLSIGYFGWRESFVGFGLILLILMLPAMLLIRPESESNADTPESDKANPFSVYKGFFAQSSLGLWLVVLLSYKLADSIGSVMIKPLLVDSGFDIGEIGVLTFWSSLVGLLGAALGAWLYYRLGRNLTLLMAGLLQALAIGSYSFVAMGWLGELGIYGVALFEQLVDGISTVALFSLMMSKCRPNHEGADYTVQASMQVMMSGVAAAVGGAIAEFLSFTSLFVVAGCIGLLTLIPVYLYIQQND